MSQAEDAVVKVPLSTFLASNKLSESLPCSLSSLRVGAEFSLVLPSGFLEAFMECETCIQRNKLPLEFVDKLVQYLQVCLLLSLQASTCAGGRSSTTWSPNRIQACRRTIFLQKEA